MGTPLPRRAEEEAEGDQAVPAPGGAGQGREERPAEDDVRQHAAWPDFQLKKQQRLYSFVFQARNWILKFPEPKESHLPLKVLASRAPQKINILNQ